MKPLNVDDLLRVELGAEMALLDVTDHQIAWLTYIVSKPADPVIMIGDPPRLPERIV